MTTSEKIVIIDDEQRMCDSLSALLTNDGYEVVTFQNSVEAIESLSTGRVDLVISDIKMPRMGGIEILRKVKLIDEGIPVMLMTGYASLDTAMEAVTEGAYDYLLKPVEFNYLSLAVKRAMEKRRGELSRLRLVEELHLSNMILQRRVGELNALYEAGKQIGSTANLGDLLRQIVVLASTVTEAQIGSIMLLDTRKQFLKIEAAIGVEPNVVKNTRLPIGESIAGHVAKSGEALIVADVESDSRFKRINKEKYGKASLLCTPLRIKNNVLGVINMASKQGGEEFTDADLRLLTTFASQAAVAVDDAYQFERNKRRLGEYEILHEMGKEIETIESLSQFGNILVEKLSRIIPIDYGIWFNWESKSGVLIPEGAVGQTDIPLTESGRIDVRKLAKDQICLSQIEFESFDFDNLSELSKLVGEKLSRNEYFPSPREAYMAIPILRRGQLAHIFYLGSDSAEAYSDEDMSLAKLVIGHSSLLFEKEKALLNSTRLMTMGNMISEISHDLRRPLTSIKGGIQIILQRLNHSDKDAEFFKIVETEITHMNDLVRELVDFSKPNKYETTNVDLRLAVKRISELVARDLEKHGITLKTEFSDSNWIIMVNENQIIEVILNLVMNAIQATPSGGTITIKGLVEKPDHRKEDYLAIKFIDTGKGIKKEDLSRIFERYYTTKSTGTGLGLSVVERIITAHNGTLAVSSKDGEGTIFTIYLPMPL